MQPERDALLRARRRGGGARRALAAAGRRGVRELRTAVDTRDARLSAAASARTVLVRVRVRSVRRRLAPVPRHRRGRRAAAVRRLLRRRHLQRHADCRQLPRVRKQDQRARLARRRRRHRAKNGGTVHLNPPH